MSQVKVSGNASGTGIFEIAAPNSNNNYTLTLPTATTTVVGTDATQTLTNKTYSNPTFSGTASGTVLVSGTAVSASGTSIDFTSIPSWVKRITVMFSQLSSNGTSNFQMQVGSGSVTTSGYAGGVSQASANLTLTTGLGITQSNAAVLNSTGQAVFTLVYPNMWVGTSSSSRSDGYMQVGGTTITLGGTLDRVRITTVNGTDTFDAGSINILYE